jgi:hypothetical protein
LRTRRKTVNSYTTSIAFLGQEKKRSVRMTYFTF